MKLKYETHRMIMLVCNTDYVNPITDFYVKNYEDFAKYEPLSSSAKTREYHRKNLEIEYDLFLKGDMVRFYLFLKQNPLRCIGTVSYRDIERGFYDSCIIGYKIDTDFRRKGYATEAILTGDSVIFEETGLNRIEAQVRVDNEASCGLLENVGYTREGIAREKIKLHGEYLDHFIFSHLKKDMYL